MNKFKSLLCFVLLFSSACTKIYEKPNENDLVIIDDISKDEQNKVQNVTIEANNSTDKNDHNENKETTKPNEKIKEQSKNEDKPNKRCFK